MSGKVDIKTRADPRPAKSRDQARLGYVWDSKDQAQLLCVLSFKYQVWDLECPRLPPCGTCGTEQEEAEDLWDFWDNPDSPRHSNTGNEVRVKNRHGESRLRVGGRRCLDEVSLRVSEVAKRAAARPSSVGTMSVSA
ncbi:unnamed protein product [Phytophthora lilii]|uniref:Unnamed protein product n=1 Tax=Phytophthora lilii TaxID=2077276 RepID=A0A9W6WGZ2_9STRA|nr:unnamed protein product [Phytophthora lilii]